MDELTKDLIKIVNSSRIHDLEKIIFILLTQKVKDLEKIVDKLEDKTWKST